MQHVVTGLFDSQSEAERAREKLITTGIDPSQITLVPGDAAPAHEQPRSFWDELKSLFVPEEDRHTYAEGLSRGGVLLSVRTDERAMPSVEDVLENAGAVDLEARETAWRDQGLEAPRTSGATQAMQAGPVPAPGGLGQAAEVNSGRTSGLTPQRAPVAEENLHRREEAIPVVEEELKVGKRVAREGRVRVRSYVVQTPVQDQVTLRNEGVKVERHPVDRPVETGDKVFQDRTIEAEAKREEPVVHKQARVKEEVVLTKQPTEHTQTVSDTVRRTEVEVEDDRDHPVEPRR
jgi:uncharacterized protein (TIGR02271 family)